MDLVETVRGPPAGDAGAAAAEVEDPRQLGRVAARLARPALEQELRRLAALDVEAGVGDVGRREQQPRRRDREPVGPGRGLVAGARRPPAAAHHVERLQEAESRERPDRASAARRLALPLEVRRHGGERVGGGRLRSLARGSGRLLDHRRDLELRRASRGARADDERAPRRVAAAGRRRQRVGGRPGRRGVGLEGTGGVRRPRAQRRFRRREQRRRRPGRARDLRAAQSRHRAPRRRPRPARGRRGRARRARRSAGPERRPLAAGLGLGPRGRDLAVGPRPRPRERAAGLDACPNGALPARAPRRGRLAQRRLHRRPDGRAAPTRPVRPAARDVRRGHRPRPPRRRARDRLAGSTRRRAGSSTTARAPRLRSTDRATAGARPGR